MSTSVYAAMRNSLVVASETQSGWETSEHLTDKSLECVAVSPDMPERVFCGTFNDGLWRSNDAGKSWERVGDGAIESDSVMSIDISPHDPDEIWVGTEPSEVYVSTDGGESWNKRPGIRDLPSESEWYFPPRPETHHVRWIEIDPHNPERVYVGIELGAFIISEDAGETWRERPPGSRRDNHSLATHPRENGRVYSAAGDGYAESHDGGESWEHPQDGLDHRYCWSVVPDPEDSDTVLMSSASGPRAAHSRGESYVYRKMNGEPWKRLDDRGLPTGEGVLRAVLATTGDPGVFYAVNNHGVFRSSNSGDGWKKLDLEWHDKFKEQTPRGLGVINE
ncbi:MAG: hypothetical protein SV377_01160 [Halobacteria archaeon]|nr:hypothetical protein [Halobacteria archaeon]